jgi:palmitoyltransferase
MTVLSRILNGRTDLVFEYVQSGNAATSKDADGVPLIRWCAYYGDVSAMRFLISHGESLPSLGDNFGLNGAAFHGHWKLCEFLIEQGADVNHALAATGETALHSALCTPVRIEHDLVLKVLLARNANVNSVTLKGATTESFMRDCRTRGETPLHRAAAFGSASTIQFLLNAGASLDAKDMNGDSPLTWASWYRRPVEILRMLCYDGFKIHPDFTSMEEHLRGKPSGSA